MVRATRASARARCSCVPVSATCTRRSADPYLQKQLAAAERQIRETLPKDEAEAAIAALKTAIGRLYLEGSPRHTFQDYRRSGAQFVKQFLDIEKAVKDGRGFGLDLSRTATFAHSQGNMDSNLLRGFFAAAGRTSPTIGPIYGLAPATSGSPIADDDPALETATKLLGGEAARQSVRHLDPDLVREHAPRALMLYNAATFVSDVDSRAAIPGGQNLPGLGLGDRVNRFVGDAKHGFDLGPYDHYGMFAWGALRNAFARWKDIEHRDARRDELDGLLARP